MQHVCTRHTSGAGNKLWRQYCLGGRRGSLPRSEPCAAPLFSGNRSGASYVFIHEGKTLKRFSFRNPRATKTMGGKSCGGIDSSLYRCQTIACRLSHLETTGGDEGASLLHR